MPALPTFILFPVKGVMIDAIEEDLSFENEFTLVVRVLNDSRVFFLFTMITSLASFFIRSGNWNNFTNYFG